MLCPSMNCTNTFGMYIQTAKCQPFMDSQSSGRRLLSPEAGQVCPQLPELLLHPHLLQSQVLCHPFMSVDVPCWHAIHRVHLQQVHQRSRPPYDNRLGVTKL